MLLVPDIRAMQRRSADTALAAVVRQTQQWQVPQILTARAPNPVMPAPVAATAETAETADTEYGPVQYGETLSEIAVRVSADGVSMHRMMTALFEANPHAFGDNIDLLREGAVLTVPPVDAIDRIEALAALN